MDKALVPYQAPYPVSPVSKVDPSDSEYVFIFIHPTSQETSQLPAPEEKKEKTSTQWRKYLLSLAKMILFYGY